MIISSTSYLELAKKKYPNMSENEILKNCPNTLGLMACRCSTFADNCNDCWRNGVDEYDLRES